MSPTRSSPRACENQITASRELRSERLRRQAAAAHQVYTMARMQMYGERTCEQGRRVDLEYLPRHNMLQPGRSSVGGRSTGSIGGFRSRAADSFTLST